MDKKLNIGANFSISETLWNEVKTHLERTGLDVLHGLKDFSPVDKLALIVITEGKISGISD